MTATPEAEQVVAAAQLLFGAGVMSHSGHANLSARTAADRFVLTNSGSIRDLTADQLVTVETQGDTIEGVLAPENAEIVAMHSVIYRARPHVGAVIHTHSPAATAFALAHRPLPCRAEPLLRFGQAEQVPVIPWGPRGSDISVRGISEALDRQPATSAMLLANHGLLVFAPIPSPQPSSWWPSRRPPRPNSPRRPSAEQSTSPKAPSTPFETRWPAAAHDRQNRL